MYNAYDILYGVSLWVGGFVFIFRRELWAFLVKCVQVVRHVPDAYWTIYRAGRHDRQIFNALYRGGGWTPEGLEAAHDEMMCHVYFGCERCEQLQAKRVDQDHEFVQEHQKRTGAR